MEVFTILPDHPLYADALDLRHSVFFQPYDLPKDVTADELEPVSTHVVITDDGKLLAYGRVSPLTTFEYRISQIVVSPNEQGRGLSTELLNRLITEAKSLGAKRVRLGAQVSAQGLYERYGFKPISEIYIVELTGVPHVKMALDLI